MKKPERCSIQFCDLVLFSNIQEAMQQKIVQKSLLPYPETITLLSTNVRDMPTRISFQRVLTMATDVYKLEWTRSRTTIQAGVASIMQKDAFMDTIVVCSDGAVTHNKLTLGLVLPDLHQVSVYDLPVEHTILMPDHSVFEVQVGTKIVIYGAQSFAPLIMLFPEFDRCNFPPHA